MHDYEQLSSRFNCLLVILKKNSWPLSQNKILLLKLRQFMSTRSTKTRSQSPSFLPSAWLIKPTGPWELFVTVQCLYLLTEEERHSHLVEINCIQYYGKCSFLIHFVHIFECTSFRWTLCAYWVIAVFVWPVLNRWMFWKHLMVSSPRFQIIGAWSGIIWILIFMIPVVFASMIHDSYKNFPPDSWFTKTSDHLLT